MNTPDEGLLQRAKQGDEAAFRTLLERHRPALEAQARRQLPGALRRRVSESDVIQEASLAAFLALGTFEPEGPDALGHWLARIVTSKVKEAGRRHLGTKKRAAGREVSAPHRPPTAEIRRPGPTASAELAARDLLTIIRAAKATLSPDHQEVLRLVHAQGRTIAETAVLMSRSNGATRKLYGRALTQLAARLPEDDVERRP